MTIHSFPNRAGWKSPVGIIDPGYTTGLIGAWRFGAIAGLSDAECIAACYPNKAPNRGLAGPQSAMVIGAPDVETDWFEFAAGTDWIASGLEWPQITEPEEFCVVMVIATDQTPINSTATRPFFGGWYGQNSGQGTALIASALTTYQAVTYETSVSAKTANLSTSGAPGGVSLWRAVAVSRFGTTLRIENLTADGTTDVVDTVLASILQGGRPFIMGSGWNIYTGGAVAKIHAGLVYELTGADLTAPQKATILASLRAGVAGTALASTF